jgi:hypothetical protein
MQLLLLLLRAQAQLQLLLLLLLQQLLLLLLLQLLLLLLMHHQPRAGYGRIQLRMHRRALCCRHLQGTIPSTCPTTSASVWLPAATRMAYAEPAATSW